jgi:hypothetical protein
MILDMAAIPRGPLTRPKSGTLDYTDRYAGNIERFRMASRDQAFRQLEENKEWANIAKYIAALEGRYWDKKRAVYRSRFSDNQMARARKDTLAMYTDVQPTIAVGCNNQSYVRTSEILTNVILHEWLRENMDLRLAEAIDHALFSVGYWKINGAPGKVSVLACGMDTVLPINSTSNLQESSAILYRTYKKIAYFWEKFGKEKAEQVARSCRNFARQGEETYSAGMLMTEYTYDRLSPAMKRLMRNRRPTNQTQDTDDVFPVSELEELWIEDLSVNETKQDVIVKHPDLPIDRHNFWYRVKPGERLYPRKRLMVFGGDILLYDGPSPYWTTRYPFARLALDPVVWAPGGLSKYRTLLPLNEGINEITAGVFDTIKKAINQTYAYKRGAIADSDWDRFFPDMPGAKLRMTPLGDPQRDIRPIPPPELPAYVREFLMQYLLPVFDRHAGTMDVASLSKKKQVPGGDTMEQIRDAQSGPIRLEGRRIEVFLRDAGEVAASHILQYFSRNDRFQILGADGWTWEDFDFNPGDMVPAGVAKESFWKLFSVKITPNSLHGANRDREQTKAFTMFKSGALSLETFLKKMGVGDVPEEIKRIMTERQAGMVGGGAQAAGRTPRTSRGQRNGQVA